MVGIIVSTLIAVWYFKTAEGWKLPAFQWVVGGMVVYYLGFAACMYLVLRPVFGVSSGTHGFWSGLAMDLVSASVGVALAALFKHRVMRKIAQAEESTPE